MKPMEATLFLILLLIIVDLVIAGCLTGCANHATSANYNSTYFAAGTTVGFVARSFAIVALLTLSMGHLCLYLALCEHAGCAMTKFYLRYHPFRKFDRLRARLMMSRLSIARTLEADLEESMTLPSTGCPVQVCCMACRTVA